MQQNAYSAEFHGAGATFNVTTKSGGNTFHGSLFEFMRNDAFDSKNFFAVNKEKLTRNQFGGTLGGPVMIPGLVRRAEQDVLFRELRRTPARAGCHRCQHRAVRRAAPG